MRVKERLLSGVEGLLRVGHALQAEADEHPRQVLLGVPPLARTRHAWQRVPLQQPILDRIPWQLHQDGVGREDIEDNGRGDRGGVR